MYNVIEHVTELFNNYYLFIYLLLFIIYDL